MTWLAQHSLRLRFLLPLFAIFALGLACTGAPDRATVETTVPAATLTTRPEPQPSATESISVKQEPTLEKPVPSTSTPVTQTYNRPRADEIMTILAKDAIPAILNPQFLSVAGASSVNDDDEPVLGIEINGEAHAYSIPWLGRVEIVNDEVGGRKIAVTW